MPVLALLRGLGRELGLVHLALDRVAVDGKNVDAVAGNLGDVALFEIDELLRDRQQRGHAGRDEVFAYS